jgi:hypothetical protein
LPKAWIRCPKLVLLDGMFFLVSPCWLLVGLGAFGSKVKPAERTLMRAQASIVEKANYSLDGHRGARKKRFLVNAAIESLQNDDMIIILTPCIESGC